jgi:hypothetical protein
LRRVVFPLPRKPEKKVTGIARKTQDSWSWPCRTPILAWTFGGFSRP